MTSTRSRLLLIALTTSALSACAATDATAPLQPRSPSSVVREDVFAPGDTIADASCRSGYTSANGRCGG